LSTEADNNRLSLVVRTVPSDSPTTSVRVRSFLRVGSPWIIVAIIGLVIAIVLIVIGTRRARRPKDAVVPAGDIEPLEDELNSVPEASRPVIRRLGERADDAKSTSRTGEVPVVEQARRSTTVRRLDDDRPFLDDDMLVEVDDVDEGVDDEVEFDEADEDEDLPPARSRPAPSRTRQPARSTQIPRLSQQTRSRQAARKAASPKPKAAAKSAKSKAAKKTTAAKRKPKKVVRKAGKKAQPPKGFIPLDDL
jgi:phosphate/sulfate permease